MKNRIVVFASGGGSNFKSIYNNILNGKIENSIISILVSNNPLSGAVLFAKDRGIETFILNTKRYPNKNDYNNILIQKLDKVKPALIVLAGYMKLIPSIITSIYDKRIINIHPAKLPDFGGKGFYGMKVHEAVIKSGIKETAVTIHYVNEEYDQGMIIHEERVVVDKNDSIESLAKKVLSVEHSVYSKIINKILNN
tara:strand:+ start:13620 stop:14207 length:588 start_codon:yes stop_codon:yes gene_type:complete